MRYKHGYNTPLNKDGKIKMLILSRALSESVIIDDNIEVKIIGISRGQVKLGFIAPQDVVIHRREIQERIKNGEEAHAVTMDRLTKNGE